MLCGKFVFIYVSSSDTVAEIAGFRVMMVKKEDCELSQHSVVR